MGSASSVVITKPTGTADGDLLVAIIGAIDSISAGPSGWTLTAGSPATNSQGFDVYCYYKTASSEGASYTWTMNSSTPCGGVIMRVQFPHGTPFGSENEASVTNDDTPSFAASVTPAEANSLIVMAIGASQTGVSASPGYAVATDNPTWTERHNTTSSASTLAVATAVRSATTATGDASATFVGSSTNTTDSACLMVVFRPLASAALTGTAPLLAATSTLIAADTSSSTNVSTAILTQNPSSLIAPSARSADPTWAHQTRTSTTWTHANR